LLRLGAVVARAITTRAVADKRIWVLDGDLGDSYGLDTTVSQIGARFVQTGIAEQTLVSVAAGLAACGATPWVFSFASFLCCRAYDQIRVCVSQTGLPVVLVGSHAGGCAGSNGKTHALMNDVALMSSLPNIDIWAPADSRDAEDTVASVLNRERPAYIRLPRDGQPDLAHYHGSGTRSFGEPRRLCVLSTGLGTQWALEARRRLAERGWDLPVLHIARIAPFPLAEVRDRLAGCDRLIVMEDHYESGGLADIVRRSLGRHSIVTMAWPSGWVGASGDSESLRRACALDDVSLTARCEHELRHSDNVRSTLTRERSLLID
jgi:transketolase